MSGLNVMDFAIGFQGSAAVLDEGSLTVGEA
jgi:hypothetical protein